MGAMSEKLVREQMCFGGTFASAITHGVVELLAGYEMSSSSSSSSSSSLSLSSLSSSESSLSSLSSSESFYSPDIDIDVEFPIASSSGPYINLGLYTGCAAEDATHWPWIYGGDGLVYAVNDKFFYNPLPVPAVLISSTDLWFDADLAVDGVSLSISLLSINCPVYTSIPAGTVISGVIPPGGSVHLQVVDRYGVNTGGTGGIDWVASP